MTKRTSAVLAFVFVLAAAGGLSAQAPDRFFDAAAPPGDTFRLTIFYPSAGSLRALLGVRDQGFVSFDNIEIVGVHHEKERTNYAEAVKFAAESLPGKIHFHVVSADLEPGTLYEDNAATPELRRIFELSDGIIFFGGPDIVPALYGGKTSLLTRIEDPYRHYLEISMIHHLLGGSQNPKTRAFLDKRPGFPVLGICLGMQSLNVGTGGTLVQDIWTEIYGAAFVEEVIDLGQSNWHTNPYPRIAPLDRTLLPYMLHPIKPAEGSAVWASLGLNAADRPYVMSAHHQSPGTIGKGFNVIATSLDGRVVEAIGHTSFPHVLGVQFHPEFPMLWDATPKYRIAPEDPDLFGCRSLLDAHPPSTEFHRRLWSWFFGSFRK